VFVVLQVRLTGNPPNSDGNGVDEKLGFIMFECGLEGVLLKVVKRSQFEKGENRNETKKEEPEAEASHADTVRSRDELEEQTAANSASGAFVCVLRLQATLCVLQILFCACRPHFMHFRCCFVPAGHILYISDVVLRL
jgi:hypothetical protein